MSLRALLRRAPALAGIVALPLVLAACGSGPGTPGRTAEGPYRPGHPRYTTAAYEINGVWYYPKVDYDYDSTGTASWYGPQFDQRLTANGEIFDMNQPSAAHKTLPLPSVVEVTNLENGRSLELRVNDRGPFVGDRLIDVSRRAAQLLGFESAGTAQVRVRILKDQSIQVAEAAMRGETGQVVVAAAAPAAAVAPIPAAPPSAPTRLAAAEPPPIEPPPTRLAAAPAAEPLPPVVEPLPPVAEPAPTAPPRTVAGRIGASLFPPAAAATMAPRPAVSHVVAAQPTSGIFIQAGAFAVKDNAERVQSRVARLGAVRLTTAAVNGVAVYRVRLGPLSSVAEANELLARVVNSGYAGARIVTD